MYFYSEEVIMAINYYILKGSNVVDTRAIRKFNNVKSYDRCKINFYWHNLKYLAEKGYIKLVRKRSPKVYKLPKKIIIIGD